MVNFGNEIDVWWFEWVVVWNLDVEFEDSVGVGGVFWTYYYSSPVTGFVLVLVG
jgi:hypothetical protein